MFNALLQQCESDEIADVVHRSSTQVLDQGCKRDVALIKRAGLPLTVWDVRAAFFTRKDKR